MIPYTREPDQFIELENQSIACFNSAKGENIDLVTVDSFGEEWSKFDRFDPEEVQKIGDEYFDLLDLSTLKNMTALDLGCGSGRWSLYAAQYFKFVESVDPSQAVLVATKVSEKVDNIRVTQASVDQIPFEDGQFDFVFSLGVLHHIPDTAMAMKKAVCKLKAGGKFLVYLYYDLDNRGFLFRTLFNLSTILRRAISTMPARLKKIFCDIIATLVYLPFVFLASLLKLMGINFWRKIPLSYYVGKSFFVIRNDALDRFGTPLEQRFTKTQIEEMMRASGLTAITFSNKPPYWHAVGEKK